MALAIRPSAPPPVLGRLGALAQRQGLPRLADRLGSLQSFVEQDMRDFESELQRMPRGPQAVVRAAHHLLDLGGKHLRPMCVVLAAKCGAGFDDRARRLAIAVELVHSATLLHDDVVDVGEMRRGAPAARCVYGNAASIFAGDWLLVHALRQIRRAGFDRLLDSMLAIIDEMILAESVQLESRGRLNAEIGDYFRVVEGKTAALFRWAMIAGGVAGGLDDDACRALERYGFHLGVAFQAVDDLLDFSGDPALTGKSMLGDLREGKMTYPLLLALDRDPELTPVVEELIARGDERPPAAIITRVREALERTGAIEDCRALARDRASEAIACLAAIPGGPAADALVTVAEATVHRES